MDFRGHLASFLEENSTRNPWKVRLENTFEQATENQTFYGRKLMLSKLKNIAKTMEGLSKSHFSHIRQEVKKNTQDLLFWRGFWGPTRSKMEKQSLRHRHRKTYFFVKDSVWIFGSFWTSWTTLKSDIFKVFELMLSLLRHLGARRIPKVLQESPRGRFFMILDHFADVLGANFHIFRSPF